MEQIYRVNTTGEFLSEYREKVRVIRAHNPEAEIPPETLGINALHAVREMVRKIENPDAPRLTPADNLRIEVNALQTEVANDLAYYVQRGIVDRKDFPFPDEDQPMLARKNKLLALKSRIHEAKDAHHLPAEAKVKILEREFRAFKLETTARIHALEQELART